MQRRRRAFRRRKLRLFGTGPASGEDSRLYHGIGPHRELIGRTLSELAVASASRVHAKLSSRIDLSAVDLAARVLPTHLAGVVSGPARKRDIAVAVNGRIEAVGRTALLKGDQRESFSVLVPEWALRQGRNDVRVFEVRGRPGALRLVALN
jgi:hypothetical protein